MPQLHSGFPRGLLAAGHDPNLPGAKFGRMFPKLTPGKYGTNSEASLLKLGAAMSAELEAPKDGPDGEESGIPALYTYFSQFIDHDLTFDPNSTFAKQNDQPAQVDFRTPGFDLDNIYGRGPGDQPYLYDSDQKTLLLGDPLQQGDPNAHDLQRNRLDRALIGDPRNDENAIVSQFQGLMIHFHNNVVKKHPDKALHEIQQMVRNHYQYVVVHDFLERIVSQSVLNLLKNKKGVYDQKKLKFYKIKKYAYMPLEFSVAAYRLGHSMVRPGYRLNSLVLLPIFPTADSSEGLVGFRRMNIQWGIDWGRFIDIDQRPYGKESQSPDEEAKLPPDIKKQNFERLQFAYRIDTSIVNPLSTLPPSVANNPPKSLAQRNLLRGLEFGMPTGQQVAKQMGIKPLKDKEIQIGKMGENLTDKDIVTVVGKEFKGKCPLWTYVLAEAMHHAATLNIPTTGAEKIETPQLGPVGGRIVAEVFLGLIFADKNSFLNKDPAWSPDAVNDYKLKDLVREALA